MKHAVLLMAYGSPTRMEDVMEYLQGIYEGKPVPQYAIDENTRKYRMFGGKSPSNEIVESVAEKLSALLCSKGDFRVFLGNKHWKPTLEDAVVEISRYSPDDIIAVPLFPFPTQNVESSYSIPLKEALKRNDLSVPLNVVNGFNNEAGFIEAWREVLGNFVEDGDKEPFFIFSAHSLPTMRNAEEQYRDSFFRTVEKIAGELGMKKFAAGFQSRGKYGSTWLEPSVYDVLDRNFDKIGDTVVAIPLGFIYDHLEILYDLDYEFGGKVREKGRNYLRTGLPNDSDAFVTCLANAVTGAISSNK